MEFSSQLQSRQVQLDALISLLDDPDSEIYSQVSRQLFALGSDAILPLEEAWGSTHDQLRQQRLEDIIHGIQFSEVCQALRHWSQNDPLNLLQGFITISRYRYPDLDAGALSRQVDQLARQVWIEMNGQMTSLEKVKAMNQVFFNILGFGNTEDQGRDSGSYYLNSILQSKKGNHLSLGLLYVMVGVGAGLPLAGVNLPGHFIAAFTNRPPEGSGMGIDSPEVLFYINPLSRGAVFTRKEVALYLKEGNIESHERYFHPATCRQLIRRIADELKEAYSRENQPQKANEMSELRKAIC